MIRHRILAASLGILTLCSSATAAVIYDESGSGDLDASATDLGSLSLGSNEIVGSWPVSPPSDSDRFSVTLATGLQIDSINLSYDLLRSGEILSTSLGTNGDLYDDSFLPVIEFSTAGYSEGTSVVFIDSLGRETETGALDTTLAGSIWDFTLTGSVILAAKSWTVSIETSEFDGSEGSVPGPASLPLMIFGLAGLSWLRQRQE